jgi:carboxyl-terminal processing protease
MLYNGIKEFDKNAKYFPILEIGQPIEKIQPYMSSLQDNNILYIRLGTINEYTADQFLQTVSAYPNVQGVILDLRGNKGGYLKYALDIADAFLNRGVMIYTIGRYIGKPKIYKANDVEFLKGKPIAVLVDGETASAAEIIAIALQKNNRAIIIGSQTYGKGTVQNIFTLNNGGAIALTTEEFLGFDKVIINKTGLKPDICSSFYETADDLDNILAKDVAHLKCPKIVNNSSIDEDIANKYILYPIK